MTSNREKTRKIHFEPKKSGVLVIKILENFNDMIEWLIKILKTSPLFVSENEFFLFFPSLTSFVSPNFEDFQKKNRKTFILSAVTWSPFADKYVGLPFLD